MTDKPTFREFLILSRKDVVKSKGGAYYAAVNITQAKRLHMGMFVGALLLLLTVLIFIAYGVESSLWPTLIFDILICQSLLSFLCLCLQYRYTRYMRITEDSELYSGVSRMKFSRKPAFVSLSLMAVLLVFVILQSTGAAYVRYWLGGGAVVTEMSVQYDGHLLSKDTAAADPVIDLPSFLGNTIISFSVTTSGSPETLQIKLGDEIANGYKSYEWRWFWEPDYFVQHGFIDTRFADIHPGSTLTLTCGSLTREWVFEVADKEAS